MLSKDKGKDTPDWLQYAFDKVIKLKYFRSGQMQHEAVKMHFEWNFTGVGR